MRLISIAFFLFISPLRAALAQSGSSGAIRGIAVDATGTIVQGVEILIVDLNRATQTNPNGMYVFDSVPAGVHQVRARRGGS